MLQYSVRQFTLEYIDPVADLLAARRRERRKHCPFLSRGLDDASTARRILEEAGTGFVMLGDNGSPGGFMFPRREDDRVWGDAIVLETDAWAFREDIPFPTAARLYAAGFGPLMTDVFEQRVYCPSYDLNALDTWFRLGFGLEQIYAAASLSEIETAHPDIEGLVIRRASSGDGDILSSFSSLIALMQAGPPVWAGAPSPYLEDLRRGFAQLPEEEEAVVLLAFIGGKAVGYQAWYPVPDDPAEGAIELTVGATVPEMRGRGVGSALTARGVKEALAAGYTACFIDWRAANPFSSAFWPDRGFKPFAYRLARHFPPSACENIGRGGVY